MAARPNRRTQSRRRRPVRRPPQGQPWLWIALGVVAAVAAAVAVLASDGDDGATTPAGVEETRSVEVTGTPLSAFEGGADLSLGQAIPEVQGASFDGTPVRIAGEGQPMVIAFLAHWCPHCQREVPLLTGYLETNPLPDAVEVITVSTSTSPDRPNYPPSAWLAREGWPGPVLADSADGAAAQAFGLTSFPYFVAVNAAGEVVARTSGEISSSQFAELVELASVGA